MSNKESIAQTKSGKIKGDFNNGVYVFKGIPYAAPPVGELRWQVPHPVKPWDGIRPAVEFGNVSPQNDLPGGEAPGLNIIEPKDEDCLYLNIWTQGLDDAKRPVMIWIHGGAFIIGAGSQAMFDGTKIAKKGDVVLVSINYRLGAFGFINLKEITGGKIPATGNEGLLDQIAAIDWVYENIRSFGGDPDNITVFGESAGAMSTGSLMGMPAARGKFGKAILESGAANTVGDLDDCVRISEEFIKTLGLKGNDINGLRSLTTDQLMSAQQKLGMILQMNEGRITPFQPVIDGKVIPEIPIRAIEKGSASGVKTLAGSNLEEFKLFDIMVPGYKNTTEDDAFKFMQKMIPQEHVSIVLTTYKKELEKHSSNVTPADVLTAIKTDLMFRMPVINLVEAQYRNNQLAYNYLFNWESPVMGGIFGACHALEVGFVFGTHDDTFCGTGPEADKLSDKMQDAWIAFARTGDPGCKSLGKWEPYGGSRKTMIFGKACGVINAPYDGERAVWDQLDITFTKPI